MMDPPLAVWLNGSVNARQGSPNLKEELKGPYFLTCRRRKLEWPELPTKGGWRVKSLASRSVKFGPCPSPYGERATLSIAASPPFWGTPPSSSLAMLLPP